MSLRAGKLLKEQPKEKPELQIFHRLKKQEQFLFTFLLNLKVEATNNRAERALRPAVISRKISCGNRSFKGANTWQVNASIIATTKKRNQPLQNIISSVLPTG